VLLLTTRAAFPIRLRKRPTYAAGDRSHACEVRRAVLTLRRIHGYKDHVGLPDEVWQALGAREGEPSSTRPPRHQAIEARLVERYPVLSEPRDAFFVPIQARHPMSYVCQERRRHEPDVPSPDDADIKAFDPCPCSIPGMIHRSVRTPRVAIPYATWSTSYGLPDVQVFSRRGPLRSATARSSARPLGKGKNSRCG
jgi:hypothetical protein